MTRKITFIGLLLLYIFLTIMSTFNGGDFDVYLDAAIKLNQGDNIYAPPFIKGLQYFYSPLFALLLIPFSSYVFTIELIWLLLSGVWFCRILILISKYFDYSFLTNKEVNVWVGISVFLVLRFLLYNISMIQITVFLLWAILESLQLIRKEKVFMGALLLALSINIKLMPLVMVPYLIYRGYFKSVFYVVTISIVLLVLPAIFVGYDYNMFLLGEWWNIINPSNSEHVIEAEISFQSLVGTVPVFLTETESIINIKRNFINLDIETVTLITNIFRAFVVGFTLYFLGKPFQKNASKLSEIRSIGYLLLAIPLIFPHQQKYSFLLMLPIIAYIVFYCIVKWKYDNSTSFKVYLSLFILVSIVFTPMIGSDFIGRFSYDLLQHFRVLGICAFLLIPLAAAASPKKLEELIKLNNK